MPLLRLVSGNLIECQKKVLNTKSGTNLAPNFVNQHLLPDMYFNGQFLIKK